ncbi:DUF1538 domain-containing protein [Cerasicoccus maritimus]|uniref:DUF1538 domain-containing protein n=1 Tax=Cerasicoccus maritimus TaxID=490089 RepID=UPI0028525CD0|nr:DUF1538 domain-containing protein [Cerasicoccus maritimus]
MSGDGQSMAWSSPKLGLRGTLRLLTPYFRDKFLEQVKSIWFIIVYLAAFQILILGVPLVYAAMIGVGVFVVALGLMFFMEGLRLGLMPLGEIIGAVLPRNAKLPAILAFAFVLGGLATFAEPAIAVLRAAGAGVKPDDAPLLYSLLNDFATQLVMSVAIGVGCAVLLGVLRFFRGWSLKNFILPLIGLLCVLTFFAHNNEVLGPIIGLAWDCGAVTTGPVTVPLVLALGIGVCRIVGDEDSSNAGFGIVTLASLFPIIAVLLLGLYHYAAKDYIGAENYAGAESSLLPEYNVEAAQPPAALLHEVEAAPLMAEEPISEEEYQQFLLTGDLPEDVSVSFEGGATQLVNGRLVQSGAQIVYERHEDPSLWAQDIEEWDPQANFPEEFKTALLGALQAIVPLVIFLFVILKLLVKEPIRDLDQLLVGIVFALGGMALFGLGITMGLTPLGEQLGSNIPAAFASISPWGLEASFGPLVNAEHFGKLIAVLFGFMLGYGATLAEPALNALGVTVQKITAGAFRKNLLMQSVAIGVGLGIATGVCKIAYNLPLAWLLIPPYLLLLFLTYISTEEFVNFGWDSAGVTTGPITVPLVLAMGLGIGANVPGVIDGFGVLALASVGPILTVLIVGLIVRQQAEAAEHVEGGLADE